MAYLGLSPEGGMVCTMDMVEYVNPRTGETTYGSSSCPPDGFVRVGEIEKPTQLTPQQIEKAVKREQSPMTLYVIGAIAAYLLLMR